MSVDRDFEVALLVKVRGFGTTHHEHQAAYAVTRALRIQVGDGVRVFWHGGFHDGDEVAYDPVVGDGERVPGYIPAVDAGPPWAPPVTGPLSDPPGSV